jgi:UDP-glucose 4-epimerase
VLVYGEGVKGNMAALVDLARSGFPLPFGGLTSRRSLLSLDNLVAAVDAVLRAPDPLRRPLIVADPDPMTVPEMIAALREGLGRRPALVPVPAPLLDLAARLSGRSEIYRRLSGSLVASPAALMGLGWRPVQTTREGLARLARTAAPRPAGGA